MTWWVPWQYSFSRIQAEKSETTDMKVAKIEKSKATRNEQRGDLKLQMENASLGSIAVQFYITQAEKE